MTDPLVSVIIPVFNGANFLRESVESVLAQTYGAIEILVVDDGSTDETPAIVRSFKDTVRPFWKPNGGTASALNLALPEARGKYVAWLSHDDLFVPEKTAAQVAQLEQNPEVGFCYSSFAVIDDHGALLRNVDSPHYSRARAVRELLVANYIHGCTTMVRKDLYCAVGRFREDLRYVQDLDMWFRLLVFTDAIRHPGYLVKGRVHPDRGSANSLALHREHLFLAREIITAWQGDKLCRGGDRPKSVSSEAGKAEDLALLSRVAFAHRAHGQAVLHVMRSLCLDPMPSGPGWPVMASMGRTLLARFLGPACARLLRARRVQ